MNLLNEDIEIRYSPLSDIGAGIVFGLGYNLINYVYGDSFESQKKELKANKCLSFERAKTLEEFNIIIKQNEKDEKINPFEILRKITNLELNADISTYNNLLNFCIANGKFNYADRLEEEIFDFTSPVQHDLTTFNIILKGIACKIESETQTDKIEILLNKMRNILSEMLKTTNMRPNEISLNTCIDILTKAGKFKDAWEMFENMKNTYDISPDNYSYSTIVKALRGKPDSDMLEKALKFLELIKTAKGKNEEVIFNCLIECCFKLGDIAKAEHLLKEMSISSIPISKVTYSLMIKGYGTYYLLDKVLELFARMKKNNIFANEVIYGCILNACVRCSEIKKAKEIYDEMKKSNYQSNLFISTTMIKCYARAGDFKGAISIYEELLNSKLTVNIVLYNAILDACVQCREYAKMTEIYKQLKKRINEDGYRPDLITISTLVKGYSKSKNMKKVLKIYYKMSILQENGEIKLDEVFYNTVLDSCVRNNLIEKGLEILKVMKANRISFSNVTYSIIIKLHSKDNDSIKTFEVLEEMKRNNVIPGIIVYTCLIQTCLKNKNFDKAISLFEEIKSQKITPDHVLYSSIINGCLFNKRYDKAYLYLIDSFNGNVRLPNYIYNKYFGILLSKHIQLKNNLRLIYTEKIYTMLKMRNYLLDKETILKMTAFVCKYKGISANIFNRVILK